MTKRPDHPNTCNWHIDNFTVPCKNHCSMDPMAGWEYWDPECPQHGWTAQNAWYDEMEVARENRVVFVKQIDLDPKWARAVATIVHYLWNADPKDRQKLLVTLALADEQSLWDYLHAEKAG